MQLEDLIRRFRVQANDKVEPYFNDDEDVIAWLNDAVKEACIRGRLIREWINSDVCEVDVLSGQNQYKLHESLYEISSARLLDLPSYRPANLLLVSPETLDRIYNGCSLDWRTMTGEPKYIIQSDTNFHLSPVPDKDYKIRLEGYRVPLVNMKDDTDEPEINSLHHVHLIQWALAQAFSVPDAEFFDANRAAMAEQAFTEYFGQRPDSDLRRITREDVPHHVIPFMP
ncbi:hypothetical protein LVY74_01585 [Acinetobacter sp. ME22]|uniref:phage adaptor protein n=1 Tax=Acinetobacter sp. ME22 TaxID=2904802 RepID=UPI001ED9D4C8|nr:DUF6682 family protein [Acinetobacter sp. ME22]MCG2572248.1 hypothetical protein [Acinetobacter sp. ME22]